MPIHTTPYYPTPYPSRAPLWTFLVDVHEGSNPTPEPEGDLEEGEDEEDWDEPTGEMEWFASR